MYRFEFLIQTEIDFFFGLGLTQTHPNPDQNLKHKTQRNPNEIVLFQAKNPQKIKELPL